MKAKDVSVMVVQLPNDQLYVNVTMKIKGHLIGAEVDGLSGVQEHIRRAKSRMLQRIIEDVEFPDAKELEYPKPEKVVGHE